MEGELSRPALGYATYVLKLDGVPKNTELMLRLTNSVMAYKLYWLAKGEPISDKPRMANGTVHPTEPIPHSVNQVVSVQTGDYGEAVVVAQLSNQYWFMGGFFSSLWFRHNSDGRDWLETGGICLRSCFWWDSHYGSIPLGDVGSATG